IITISKDFSRHIFSFYSWACHTHTTRSPASSNRMRFFHLSEKVRTTGVFNKVSSVSAPLYQKQCVDLPSIERRRSKGALWEIVVKSKTKYMRATISTLSNSDAGCTRRA